MKNTWVEITLMVVAGVLLVGVVGMVLVSCTLFHPGPPLTPFPTVPCPPTPEFPKPPTPYVLDYEELKAHPHKYIGRHNGCIW